MEQRALHKKRKKRRQEIPDLGSAEFECPKCRHAFEVPWLDIFDLQESTHGYVGFELQNEYIGCPRCGANANEESFSVYGTESPGVFDDLSEDEDNLFVEEKLEE